MYLPYTFYIDLYTTCMNIKFEFRKDIQLKGNLKSQHFDQIPY